MVEYDNRNGNLNYIIISIIKQNFINLFTKSQENCNTFLLILNNRQLRLVRTHL